MEHLRFAVDAIRTLRDVTLDPERDIASVYETAPVGCSTEQGPYLNSVCRVKTTRKPAALLSTLHQIEARRLRERKVTNGPRTLDLDLLAYGTITLNDPEMTIPHPRMHDRLFVLQPLMEIEPHWVHPVTGDAVAVLVSQTQANDPSQQIQRVTERDWISMSGV